jgi:rhodanese-related sulfurtransferase
VLLLRFCCAFRGRRLHLAFDSSKLALCRRDKEQQVRPSNCILDSTPRNTTLANYMPFMRSLPLTSISLEENSVSLQVKALLEKPDANRILIDAREPAELQATGRIPGSLNIPVNSQPDSFFITAEEFEDRFGFDRPGKEQEVIFYCKAGVRSRAAAEFAKQAGWANVGEYRGSWLDWEKNGGVKEGGR